MAQWKRNTDRHAVIELRVPLADFADFVAAYPSEGEAMRAFRELVEAALAECRTGLAKPPEFNRL
jgi:hypothetical protein